MRRSGIMLVPLVGIVALVLVIVLAGDRTDPGSLFERLVARPEDFVGEEVRVSGRVVARPGAADLFVLEGADGHRLRFEPPDDAKVAVGVRIAIRGRVEMLVDPGAAGIGTSTLVRARELAVRAG